jgi:LuxR family maltose regulon positive regulatory protein
MQPTDLKIILFGRFEVHRAGQPLTAREWRSQQNRTLFKVLLARRGHVVTADQLLDTFWPKEDPVATRRRLHVRISQLRLTLDPTRLAAYILTVDGGYTLNPDAAIWIDADVFEAHVDRARYHQKNGELAQAVQSYEAARALYRGDFLEENLYADWAYAERERLRECFLSTLTELAECYARQGHYRQAIDRCRQVLASESCREAIYVRLMLYHYQAGERIQALQAYQRCRQILADELGVQPLPATTRLAEQIHSGTL